MTVSAGVAERAADDNDLQPLIKRADAALFLAKAQGRNRIVVA